MAYMWVKAFHIIAAISWMAGLLYLPRLFVYHTMADKDGEAVRFFEIMERRLLRAIMTPAMIVSWGLGLFLAFGMGSVSFTTDIWFLAKIVLLFGLTGFHFFLARCQMNFVIGKNEYGTKFFRLINEIPTVIMILVVCLVIVRPF